MPRPCKHRRVCEMPRFNRFGPVREDGEAGFPIVMTVDEYEAIRLIDLLGLRQENCAERMNVARTTAQTIYDSARAKLAECLVNGRELYVSGGEIALCDGNTDASGCRYCYRERELQKGEQKQMRIAVTYENGQVFQHFGHTEQFKLYEIEDNKVTSSEIAESNGSGHGALAGMLRQLGVDTLLCGGIGGGARRALDDAGIRLFPGVSGDADQAVEALLSNTLVYDPNTVCSHHGEHHHDGDCGEHSCGGHHAHGHHGGEGGGHGCGAHPCGDKD